MGLLSLLPMLPLYALAELVTLTIPLDVPTDAPIVSPALVGLSIEQDRWLDWVGKEERNEFFYNTVDNINKLAGAPMTIRIGANSEVCNARPMTTRLLMLTG